MNTVNNPFNQELTPDNCCFILIDHQVGLSTFLTSLDPAILKNNIVGMAKTAKVFSIPTILGTSWPHGPNGPTLPELVELLVPMPSLTGPL